jgi:hypothetical protein
VFTAVRHLRAAESRELSKILVLHDTIQDPDLVVLAGILCRCNHAQLLQRFVQHIDGDRMGCGFVISRMPLLKRPSELLLYRRKEMTCSFFSPAVLLAGNSKNCRTSALYAQCRILQLSWTPGHASGPILGRKQYLPLNTTSLPCLPQCHVYATLPPCWQRKPHYYPTSCMRLCVHAGALVYLVRSVSYCT